LHHHCPGYHPAISGSSKYGFVWDNKSLTQGGSPQVVKSTLGARVLAAGSEAHVCWQRVHHNGRPRLILHTSPQRVLQIGHSRITHVSSNDSLQGGVNPESDNQICGVSIRSVLLTTTFTASVSPPDPVVESGVSGCVSSYLLDRRNRRLYPQYYSAHSLDG